MGGGGGGAVLPRTRISRVCFVRSELQEKVLETIIDKSSDNGSISPGIGDSSSLLEQWRAQQTGDQQWRGSPAADDPLSEVPGAGRLQVRSLTTDSNVLRSLPVFWIMLQQATCPSLLLRYRPAALSSKVRLASCIAAMLVHCTSSVCSRPCQPGRGIHSGVFGGGLPRPSSPCCCQRMTAAPTALCTGWRWRLQQRGCGQHRRESDQGGRRVAEPHSARQPLRP